EKRGGPAATLFRIRLKDKNTLAGRLGIEQAIRLLRLPDREPVREQLPQRHLALGDEARALLLSHRRERPGRVDRELAPDHLLADVERRAAALAHERHAPPRVGATHGGHARLR